MSGKIFGEPALSDDGTVSDPTARRWSGQDLVAIVLLVVAAVAWLRWMNWPSLRAAEDAAILFRYVDNVSAGHGIVWNLGEAPVDGATDLGFMFALVAVKAVGVSAQTGALILNTIAYAGIAAGLFAFARSGSGVLFASLVSALFIVSPAVGIMNAGFGSVFFSSFVALSVLAMFRLTDEPTLGNAALLGCTAVVAGLIRPEGFIIAAALVLTAIAVGGRRVNRAAAVATALLFVAGIVFVAARWSYFGFPLPNPYYKKGGGTLHPDGLLDSVMFARSAGAVTFVLFAGVAVLAGVSRRWIAYTGCLVVLLGMWALLSNELNYGFRFQLVVLTVALFMVVDLVSRAQPVLSAQIDAGPGLKRLVPVAVAVSVGAAVAINAVETLKVVPRQIAEPAQQTIAKILAGEQDKELVVATTEAGYVCWQSGWNCVDLWGLNDKQIAHEGLLDEGELKQLSPDVIVLHAPTSPTASSIHDALDSNWIDGWEEMTDPLIRFAESGAYTLAAIVHPTHEAGYVVYVRSDEPWSQDLILDFRSVDPSIEEFYGPSATPSLPTNQ